MLIWRLGGSSNLAGPTSRISCAARRLRGVLSMSKLPSRRWVRSAGKTVILKVWSVVFWTSVGRSVSGGCPTTRRRGGEMPSRPCFLPGTAAPATSAAAGGTSSASMQAIRILRAKAGERIEGPNENGPDESGPLPKREGLLLLSGVREGRVVEAGAAQNLVAVDRQLQSGRQRVDEVAGCDGARRVGDVTGGAGGRRGASGARQLEHVVRLRLRGRGAGDRVVAEVEDRETGERVDRVADLAELALVGGQVGDCQGPVRERARDRDLPGSGCGATGLEVGQHDGNRRHAQRERVRRDTGDDLRRRVRHGRLGRGGC